MHKLGYSAHVKSVGGNTNVKLWDDFGHISDLSIQDRMKWNSCRLDDGSGTEHASGRQRRSGNCIRWLGLMPCDGPDWTRRITQNDIDQ